MEWAMNDFYVWSGSDLAEDASSLSSGQPSRDRVEMNGRRYSTVQ